MNSLLDQPARSDKGPMSKHSSDDQAARELRKFERVDIDYKAQVEVLDSKGKKVGTLRQLGRGGFMMEPEKEFNNKVRTHEFVLHESEEDLHVSVQAKLRFADARFVGFEFVDLGPDAAVEIGIIIGKYYEAEHARHHKH